MSNSYRRENVGNALNIIAERVYDNTQDKQQKNTQRRNQSVDMFGIDISRNSNSDNEAILYVSVSQDLIYYERFQFKLYIEADTAATDFQVFVKGRVRQSDGKYKKKRIDITPYLMAQTDKWIDGGREEAWPNNDLPDTEDSDDPANAYDLLQVVSMMYAEGNDEEAEAIEANDFKEVIIKGNAPFFCAMILYLKYSHLNR